MCFFRLFFRNFYINITVKWSIILKNMIAVAYLIVFLT